MQHRSGEGGTKQGPNLLAKAKGPLKKRGKSENKNLHILGGGQDMNKRNTGGKAQNGQWEGG